MFTKDYKEKIDSISADGYIKQKVLNQIREKGEKPKMEKRNSFKILRLATSVAACIAIAVTAVYVGIGRESDAKDNVIKPNTAKVSYTDIFKAVNKFMPEEPSFLDKVTNALGGVKNSVDDAEAEITVDEYSADFDGSANPETATGGASTNTSASKGNASSSEKQESSHSETNTQVEGVAESDIVKTDGKYIYSLSPANGTLRIIKAGKNPVQLSSTKLIDGVASSKAVTSSTSSFLSYDSSFNPRKEMYLVGDRVVIIGVDIRNNQAYTKAYIYDVSKPEKPEKLYECQQSGNYNDSRVIGDKLYLITHYSLNVSEIDKDKPETYIPYVGCENYDDTVKADSIHIYENCDYPEYTVICGFSVKDGSLCSSQSLLGGTENVYCSTKNIITAGYAFTDGTTAIARYSINGGKIELKAQGKIEGSLLNQFSIDEHNGYFRFVTTTTKEITGKEGNVSFYRVVDSNSLYVLDGDLKQVGAIEDLAPNEKVYSVRFMGDVAYFVTFRNVDPLFSADLSDPEKPKIIGALKIPGFSNFLFPYGNGKLLGIGQDADEKTGSTKGIKLSMFDISNPADVTEVAKAVLKENYSEALYDHKASLVDVKKNLIAFPVWTDNGNEYRIFSFENGGFVSKATARFDGTFENVRGLYIDSEFYIINDSILSVYDIESFDKINEITLN